MSKENIQFAIDLMSRDDLNLDMSTFQELPASGGYATTIEELHNCGTSACFAGYLALTPEYREFWEAKGWGTPSVQHDALVKFPTGEVIGTTEGVAEFLGVAYEPVWNLIYGVCGPDEKAQVIAELQDLLNREES